MTAPFSNRSTATVPARLLLIAGVVAIGSLGLALGLDRPDPSGPAPTDSSSMAPSLSDAGAAGLAAISVPAGDGSSPSPAATPMSAATVARLKSAYLDCVAVTSGARMGIEQAIYCQSVTDALVERHFDGRLDRLLAWWHSATREAVAAIR